MRPINGDRGLSNCVDQQHGRQALLLHAESNRIALSRYYEVDILRRVCQRPFPQTFLIRRRFPGAMIAFIDRFAQWNPGSLQSAHVIPQVHQQ